MKFSSVYWVLIFFSGIFSCSKNGFIPPPDPCTGINIVVNGIVTNTAGPGINDGSIEASASGATGFTYNLNGGAFQASGTFNNLGAGIYSITAKSGDGCVATGTFTIVVGDPCTGKVIDIIITKNETEKCGPSGSITITATGGIGFTYRLNASGTYQASNVLTNVPAGNHTVFVKDISGCEKTQAVTIVELPNGALFQNVRALITNKCSGCHMFGAAEGGARFDTDCNIVDFKLRIKARAVDLSEMPQGGPPLSAAEKKVISDWLAAGGQASN